MLYGNDYEGPSRECDNCGHFTNVHSFCHVCEMTICEGCDHTCVDPEECEHLDVEVEEGCDVDEVDGYVMYWEHITCRACNAELVERKGELVLRKRRAA